MAAHRRIDSIPRQPSSPGLLCRLPRLFLVAAIVVVTGGGRAGRVSKKAKETEPRRRRGPRKAGNVFMEASGPVTAPGRVRRRGPPGLFPPCATGTSAGAPRRKGPRRGAPFPTPRLGLARPCLAPLPGTPSALGFQVPLGLRIRGRANYSPACRWTPLLFFGVCA